MNNWLFPYHPELREKGFIATADLTDPRHDKIVFACLNDIMKATQAKYFCAGYDEFWHKRKPGEAPDKLLRGKTRAQVYLEGMLRLHSFLKQKGAKLCIYDDMLNPYHNGKRHDVYSIINKVPRDIIIWPWSDRHHEYFLDRGFECWEGSTGGIILSDKVKKRFKGYGQVIYSFGDWVRYISQPKYIHYMYAIPFSADYSWNLFEYKRGGYKEQVTSGRLVASRNIAAVQPNPNASEKMEAFDISQRMNYSFNEYLKKRKPRDYPEGSLAIEMKAGVQDIGFIPTLISANDKDCVILKKGSAQVDLPINKKLSSLIFLHTSAYNFTKADLKAMRFNKRDWPYGRPNGNYIVHYEDGDKAVVPLRSDINIYWFDAHPLTRATNDNRYIHMIKDKNGDVVNLYQLEWVNPKPEKKINKVSMTHDNILDVDIALFALSGRKVKKDE